MKTETNGERILKAKRATLLALEQLKLADPSFNKTIQELIRLINDVHIEVNGSSNIGD